MSNRPTCGRCGDLGGLTAQWKDARRAGSCNFCDEYDAPRVLEVAGKSLIVRLCQSCFKKLKEVKSDDR